MVISPTIGPTCAPFKFIADTHHIVAYVSIIVRIQIYQLYSVLFTHSQTHQQNTTIICTTNLFTILICVYAILYAYLSTYVSMFPIPMATYVIDLCPSAFYGNYTKPEHRNTNYYYLCYMNNKTTRSSNCTPWPTCPRNIPHTFQFPFFKKELPSVVYLILHNFVHTWNYTYFYIQFICLLQRSHWCPFICTPIVVTIT